jgi:hypothetical protein
MVPRRRLLDWTAKMGVLALAALCATFSDCSWASQALDSCCASGAAVLDHPCCCRPTGDAKSLSRSIDTDRLAKTRSLADLPLLSAFALWTRDPWSATIGFPPPFEGSAPPTVRRL